MGSLLEGALWLRATRESPHGPMFAATSAPKNTQGITKPLGDWTLESFIDVAGELDWISKEGKKLSKIIRQYRNYVHPREAVKDRSELSIRNAKLLWGVASEIVRDILK